FDHPKVGAVFIPHKDIRRTVFEKTPTPPYPDRWVVPSFVGTAHALLRDVFIKLGGYREILEHNTEERDFCLRLLDNGFAVRLGTAEPIHHYPSPIRDAWRGRMLERRNDICFGIMDVPFPHVLCHLPGTICSGLMFGFRNGCLQQTLAGYVNALRTSRRAWRERRPVRG